MSYVKVHLAEHDGLITLSTADDESADEVLVDDELLGNWRLIIAMHAQVQQEMAQVLDAAYSGRD